MNIVLLYSLKYLDSLNKCLLSIYCESGIGLIFGIFGIFV